MPAATRTYYFHIIDVGGLEKVVKETGLLQFSNNIEVSAYAVTDANDGITPLLVVPFGQVLRITSTEVAE